MLLKIVRNLTPEEVNERIKRFEKELNVSFEELERLFLEQKLDSRLVKAYFEWAELVDSYRAYVEGGALDYVVEEVKDLKPEQIALLTPKRVELLYQLAALRAESISDLARKVKRDVKNVYRDLQVLNGFGFVKLNRRRKGAVIPETAVKEITFLIR